MASDGKRVKSTWTNAAKVIKSATKNSRGVMKVKVFYAAYESSPVHIATVEVPHAEDMVACEHAFRLTQNIDDCWSKRDTEDGNGAVTVEVPVGRLGHRSSAVGDYFEADGRLYACMGEGFKPATRIECGKHLDFMLEGV